MQKFKFIAVFAAFGFIISLAFGIFSHSAFLSVILKAFVFAIVFAALGFGISVVSEKFLLDEGSSELSQDISNSNTSKSDSSKGNYVDITIRDEELPQSVSGNRFMVGDNHQLLNESDMNNSYQYQKVKTASEVEPDANVSFMPVRSVENLTNVSSKEAISPEAPQSNASQMQNDTAMNNLPPEDAFNADKGIDTLPDMTGFSVGQNNNSSLSDNADEDENEEEFVTSSTRSIKSEAEVPEIKDASLYAKAISSILSGEED